MGGPERSPRGQEEGQIWLPDDASELALALSFGVVDTYIHTYTLVLKIEVAWVICRAAQPDFWLFIAVI